MKKVLLTTYLLSLFSFHFSLQTPPVAAADMPNLANPMDKLQVPLPSGYMQKRGIDCDEKDADGNIESCRVPYLADYIAGWFKYLVGIGALLGVITAMVGGFLWIISSGNPQKIGQAKGYITNGIIGIVLLTTSYVILYQINPELTQLKSITLTYINKDEFAISDEDLSETNPSSIGSTNGVPWLLQTTNEAKAINYGNCSPIDGKVPSVAKTGCGLVSSLMVMEKYGTSPSLNAWTTVAINNGARVCGSGSSAAGLLKAAKEYGFSGKTGLNMAEIKSNLDAGRPVIISLRGPCTYTSGGHFVVLTGWKDKANNIASVNDPNNGKKKAEKSQISLNTLSGCTLGQTLLISK